MNNNFILLLVATILPVFAGCSFYGVNAEEIAFERVHPKESHKEIRYFETVPVPYDVLGTVTVRTERRNSMEEIVEKMQRQIAVLGGDAVTAIVQIDDPGTITKIRTTYKGTVILLKGDPGPTPSTPTPTPGVTIENLK